MEAEWVKCVVRVGPCTDMDVERWMLQLGDPLTQSSPSVHSHTHIHKDSYTCLCTVAALHPLETGGCFAPVSDDNILQERWKIKAKVVRVQQGLSKV